VEVVHNFDVAAFIDQHIAARPDSPKLTETERVVLVSALEGAVESVEPVVKALVAERDRLREAIRIHRDGKALDA
jgi:hypothetical protein